MNDFTQAASAASTKQQINELATQFLNAGFADSFAYKSQTQELQHFLSVFRDAVWRVILSQGDVPDGFFIHLYTPFCDVAIEPDERFTRTIATLKGALEGELELSQRLLLVVTVFVLEILGGHARTGLADYVEQIAVTHIHDANKVEYGAALFDQLVANSNVKIDDFLSVFERLFDTARYFSLDKVQRRSIFNWSLHILWNAPKYFNAPEWMRLYPVWLKLFNEHLRLEQIDEAMYVHFFLYHKMGNNFQTMREFAQFNREVDKPAALAYKAWGETQNLPKCKSDVQNGGKIKIVFLKDRVVMNSPFKVEYSLFAGLMAQEEFKSRYELFVCSMNYFEKSNDDNEALQMLYDIGVDFVTPAKEFHEAFYYNDHLQKAVAIRKWLLAAKTDILVACTNNYDILDFLLANRSAPVQLFWSHGNFQFDVPCIDGRITHIGEGVPESFEHFTVGLDKVFYVPPYSPKEVENLRSQYPQDAVILGSIGRLVKIDNEEYLSAVAQILNRCPKAVYLACGGGNVDSIKVKLRPLGIEDRFYFAGHVDAGVWGHLIDVFLNTFPLGAGEAYNESAAKGRACVCLRDESYKNHLKMLENDEKYQAFLHSHEEQFFRQNEPLLGLENVFSVDEYVERAVRLVCDDVLRNKAGAALEAWYTLGYNALNEAQIFSRLMEHFCIDKAAQ